MEKHFYEVLGWSKEKMELSKQNKVPFYIKVNENA